MKHTKEFFRIGRVPISITNEDSAILSIKDSIHKGNKGYVCVSTLHTVPQANRDDAYFKVMENSLMNTPDGMPLVWCGHWWGLKQVQLTSGPNIFPRMLKMHDVGLKHFFLGDTEQTLSELTKKSVNEFGAKVVGSYSPPFKPIEEYDIKEIAHIINESGANIVWTSLHAPKQDFLNSMLIPYLKDGIVCVGVGAAFRSTIGDLKQPKGKFQKMGLAGLRFKRSNTSWWWIIKWYSTHIFLLLGYFIQIKWKKAMGKKPDEL